MAASTLMVNNNNNILFNPRKRGNTYQYIKIIIHTVKQVHVSVKSVTYSWPCQKHNYRTLIDFSIRGKKHRRQICQHYNIDIFSSLAAS